jgi:hypothetical protein
VSTGAVVSTTVTVWLHCPLFPHPSVARQVRVATNAAPQVPLVTVLITATFVTPLQLSLALGESKSQAAPHSTVREG